MGCSTRSGQQEKPDKTGYNYEHEGHFSAAKVTLILYCDA